MQIIIFSSQNKVNKIIEVTNAKYIENFTIRIKFNDGSERQVDFKPFLSNSHHPAIQKYLDEDKFKQFEIIDGNLNWNDYDLIFPVYDLYQGQI